MRRILVMTALMLGGTVITVMFAFLFAYDRLKKWMNGRGML